mmetsp:Transcript_22656/g.57892  ORF Transcript_22656/g.57892 Transcript_22656/m.57892 type:complete len:213 (-) Transcript_22656:1378-2016(-)
MRRLHGPRKLLAANPACLRCKQPTAVRPAHRPAEGARPEYPGVYRGPGQRHGGAGSAPGPRAPRPDLRGDRLLDGLLGLAAGPLARGEGAAVGGAVRSPRAEGSHHLRPVFQAALCRPGFVGRPPAALEAGFVQAGPGRAPRRGPRGVVGQGEAAASSGHAVQLPRSSAADAGGGGDLGPLRAGLASGVGEVAWNRGRIPAGGPHAPHPGSF